MLIVKGIATLSGGGRWMLFVLCVCVQNNCRHVIFVCDGTQLCVGGLAAADVVKNISGRERVRHILELCVKSAFGGSV